MSSFVARLLTAAGRSALVANAWMSLSMSLSSSIRRIVAQTAGARPASSAIEGEKSLAVRLLSEPRAPASGSGRS